MVVNANEIIYMWDSKLGGKRKKWKERGSRGRERRGRREVRKENAHCLFERERKENEEI